MTRKIKVLPSQLCVGLFVDLSLRWVQHPFLFSRFKIRNDEQLTLIQSLGLEDVIVWLDKSDALPLPLVKAAPEPEPQPALVQERDEAFLKKQEKIERQRAYMRGLNKATQDFQRTVANVKAVMQDMQRRPLAALEDASQVVEEITDTITDQSNILLHLMNEPKGDDGFYCHSLNVAVLSMLVAKTAGMPREEIRQAGLGGIFHDLGKLRIPSQILRKTDALSEAENNFLKMHPQYGVELASRHGDFPPRVLNVIAQHHEMLDGSGYPKGLTQGGIDKLAQLVAVANEYDNLCHGRRDKHPMPPHAVLSHLFRHGKELFNQELVQHFIRVLGVYPPGTVVQLSNDQYGLVMTVNASRLLSPAVLVYDPAIPRDQAAIIDLEEEGLTVSRTVRIAALPTAVFDYLKPRSDISYFMELGKRSA
ncbi:HD-GYP domain-containing protein [Gallaecimonas kandeliae]|uniref:HD-GYP domain-containing protein n=1 Tax=Gallaecimonas kandeliae TaxID=3029055 RepID=UPI0026490957|nr:HD-GYP domain-containing protein [Gallaecimonas kandeliae]WKE66947.1 HD-GYP domain-containing protein [Gallaecimonas kandeliae]